MRVLCLKNHLFKTFNVNRETENEFSKDSDSRELIYS